VTRTLDDIRPCVRIVEPHVAVACKSISKVSYVLDTVISGRRGGCQACMRKPAATGGTQAVPDINDIMEGSGFLARRFGGATIKSPTPASKSGMLCS